MKDYYVFKFGDVKKRSELAIFDLDYTLIKPKKYKFPKNKDDWMFLHDNIQIKLKQVSITHNIMIITNQSRIKDDKSLDDFKYKLNNIQKELDVPLTVCISVADNKYRKPCIGFKEVAFSEYKPKKCYYVGDAAGRPNDFADTDYKFALNLKIDFYVPEEYFLNEPTPILKINGFNPLTFKFNSDSDIKFIEDPKMVVIMGRPATGKTTFYKNYLAEYDLFSLDKYKSSSKLMKELEIALYNKKNVIIEGLLPTKIKRLFYFNIAKAHKYKCQLVHINHEMDFCMHLNKYRMLTHNIKPINIIVYRKFNKDYAEPSKNEGWDNILTIKPILDVEQDFYQYLY
jgi:bifunctional polynucleotide phosphatase/kinase